MTSSTASSASADLGKLWHGLVNAWRDMPSWSVFAWMGAEAAVTLLRSDGTQNTWLTDGVALRVSPQTKASTPFVALQLPEDLLLRRSVNLPDMADSDVRDALQLNVLGASPFPAEDLVWGYSSQASGMGQRQVSLVTASRRQIDAFIAQSADRLAGRVAPMVWALDPAGNAVAFAGYGGNQVQRLTQRKRWLAWGLLGLAGLLAAAIAITPSAQLRFRAIDANHAYVRLGEQTAELTRKRGQLQDLTDKVNAIKTLASDAVDPMRLMGRMTDVLPDDTNLVSLSIQGRKVSLYGQTPNAAALMQLLSSQADFLEVKAPIAAIRPSGGTKDTFTVDFLLAPGELTALRAAAKPVAAASAAVEAVAVVAATASAPASAPPSGAASSSAPQPKASAPQQVASTPKGGKP